MRRIFAALMAAVIVAMSLLSGVFAEEMQTETAPALPESIVLEGETAPEAEIVPEVETAVEAEITPEAEETAVPVEELFAEPAPEVTDVPVQPEAVESAAPPAEEAAESEATPRPEETPEPEETPAMQIVINAAELELGVGEKFQLKATLEGFEDAPLRFESKNSRVAKVGKGGLVTAVKAGSTVIRVSSENGSYAECTVLVKKAPTAVKLSAKKLTLGEGQEAQLTATLSKGSAGEIRFTSSADCVSVDEEGNISANFPGTAKITASTYNKKKATCSVTVLAAPDTLELKKDFLSVPVGMRAKIEPMVQEGALAQYSFESSDESIASVNEAGEVLAKESGTAVVTVNTWNGLTAACEIEVTPAPTQVSLNAEEITLGVGEKFQLIPTADFGGDAGFSYKAKNAKTASVSASGLVTAKKAGKTVVRVESFNGVCAECTVIVKKAPTAVKLSAKSLTLGEGQSTKLDAALSAGSAGEIRFSSSADCVRVDEKGNITAAFAGTAKITATTYNKKKATCTITVLEAPETLELQKDFLSIPVGAGAKIIPSVNAGAFEQYRFESSDEGIAAVDEKGRVNGISAGSAQITVWTWNGLSAVCAVEVTPVPTKVELKPAEIVLGVGEEYQLVPEVDQGEDAGYSYQSRNSKIAAVSADGVVTAKKTGSAVVRVTTFNGLTADCRVVVKKAPAAVKISPASLKLELGKSVQLHAELSPGSAGACRFYTESDILAVSSDGMVVALAEGEAQVVAESYNGKRAVCSVKVIAPVEPLVIENIFVDKQEILAGESVEWTAAATGGGEELRYLYEVLLEEKVVEKSESLSPLYVFTPEKGGSYVLRATVSDELGNSFTLCSGALLVVPDVLSAGDFEYVLEDGECTITAYIGGYSIVNIPDEIEGAPVTKIGEGAFEGMAHLKRVSLPENIQVIGKRAFAGCSSLKYLG